VNRKHQPDKAVFCCAGGQKVECCERCFFAALLPGFPASGFLATGADGLRRRRVELFRWLAGGVALTRATESGRV
jgi:hypothetical protein